MRWNVYILALIIIHVFGQVGFGQNSDLVVEGEVEDAEIVIEKDRQIKLKKEVKLYEFIKYQPDREVLSIEEDRFQTFDYDLVLEPIALRAPISTAKNKEISYHQYAKFGFGNYGSPIADVSITVPGATNTIAGVNYKHLSFSKGEIDGENSASSFNEVTAFGMVVYDKIKIRPQLTYQNDKNYWFGYPESTVVNREDIKRANNYIDFGVDFSDNNATDNWSYDWSLLLNSFKDNWLNNENTFSVIGQTSFNQKFFLENDVKFAKYENDLSVSRLYYRMLPYYRFDLGDARLSIGLSISGHDDDNPFSTDLKFFPYLNASLPLTDSFEAFASLDGGIEYNSMYSLAQMAPYVNEEFMILNTENKLDLTGGVRGKLSEKISVQGKVNYQSKTNMPVLINNFVDPSRLDIIYDTGTVGILNLGVSSKLSLSENHEIGMTFDFYNYSPEVLPQVYHRPTTELKIKGNHIFFEKLSYQWQFALKSGIKAFDPNVDVEVTLDPIPKLDMMVHYQITDRLGAFISGDNIIGQNYSEYLFYPQRGIMFRLGASYRF